MAIFKKKQKIMTEKDYLKLERRIDNLEETVRDLLDMAERYLNECSEQADFRNYASEKIIDLSNQFMDLEDIFKGQEARLDMLENHYDSVGSKIVLDIGDLRDKVEKLEDWCYVDHGENETEENCDE